MNVNVLLETSITFFGASTDIGQHQEKLIKVSETRNLQREILALQSSGNLCEEFKGKTLNVSPYVPAKV